MTDKAWVTLATNDSYALGALVLGHSLRRSGTTQQLALLVTPGVTPAMRNQLTAVFNVVQEVNVLDSRDEANLALLSRPELGITFTKLHCWRLTQFSKCVFLDADTLVIQNCDELFDRDELSAAPDAGWPDCFNSGVFVFKPSLETFTALMQFALVHGSFDGGDQGLLNMYFSNWVTDASRRLPFVYNMCSTATYSYLPAYKQYGAGVKIVHFIGPNKPWLQLLDSESRQVQPATGTEHLQPILQLWWDIFCSSVHPTLSPDMSRCRALPPSQHPSPVVAEIVTNLDTLPSEPDPSDGFWDPWESYIPPDTCHTQPSLIVQHVAQMVKPNHNTDNSCKSPEGCLGPCDIECSIEPQHPYCESCVPHTIEEQQQKVNFCSLHPFDGDTTGTYQNDGHLHCDDGCVDPHSDHNHNYHHYEQHDNNQCSQQDIEAQSQKDTDYRQQVEQHHHCGEHQQHEHQHHEHQHHEHQHHEHQHHKHQLHEHQQQHQQHNQVVHRYKTDVEPYQTNIPHEPITSVPLDGNEPCSDSPPASLSEQTAGLAGAFSQLTLGTPRSATQLALEEHLRRQTWEQGQADYMGRDSFDNIWKKICETLSTQSTAPPQETPEQKASEAVPEQKAPEAVPEQKAPEAVPEQKAPEEVPEQKAPVAVPDQKAPVAVPEQKAPAAVPEQKAPAAVPEQKAPAGIPEQNAPAAVPEQKAPEAVPEQKAPLPLLVQKAPEPVPAGTEAVIAVPSTPIIIEATPPTSPLIGAVPANVEALKVLPAVPESSPGTLPTVVGAVPKTESKLPITDPPTVATAPESAPAPSSAPAISPAPAALAPESVPAPIPSVPTPAPTPSVPAAAPTPSAPAPAPSTAAPAPSTAAPAPLTAAPTPSSPAPTPSAPAPTPSAPAPTPSTPAPTPSAPAPSAPAPTPSAPAQSSPASASPAPVPALTAAAAATPSPPTSPTTEQAPIPPKRKGAHKGAGDASKSAPQPPSPSKGSKGKGKK